MHWWFIWFLITCQPTHQWPLMFYRARSHTLPITTTWWGRYSYYLVYLVRKETDTEAKWLARRARKWPAPPHGWHMMRRVRNIGYIPNWQCFCFAFFLHPLILSLTEGYCFSWGMGHLGVANLIFIGVLSLLFDLPFVFFKSNIDFCVPSPCLDSHYSIKSKVKAKLLRRRSPWWWLVIFLSEHLTG